MVAAKKDKRKYIGRDRAMEREGGRRKGGLRFYDVGGGE